MSSSEEDSDYEPSLRSLNTSDDTASSSDNDYSSTSEEEEGGEGRAWRSLELSEERMNAAPPRFPFTGNPGITIDENPAEMSPFEFFSLFFDKRIIDSVLVETNRFAEQTGQDDSLWRPVTEAELFVFFAMKMLGGIVKMPEEEMNWSKDELLERPIFRKLMTLKRYRKIKQYLHFVNNATHDAQTHPNPKLYKIYDVFIFFLFLFTFGNKIMRNYGENIWFIGRRVNSYICPQRYFQNKKLTTKMGKNNNYKLFS